MITISYDNLMMALALFTASCVAVGWVIKIVKGIKKPSEKINKKLESDNKRIGALEAAIQEILKVQPMILRSEYVILQHLRTNNSTGEIARQERAISEYLFNK